MATQFSNVTPFEGQLTESALEHLMDAGRQQRLASRARFLAEHPNYGPCAVAGCEGLVDLDRFARWTDEAGRRHGLCPRTSIHSRLFPRLFAAPQRPAQARRSLPIDNMVVLTPEQPDEPAQPRRRQRKESPAA